MIENSSVFYDAISERFPIGMNRIEWQNVRLKEQIDILPEPREISAEELQGLLTQHMPTVRRWLDQAGVGPSDDVFWTGDMCDPALKMTAQLLVELFPVLFSFSQHSYALPEDASWCLNYVMEGELFFAKSAVTSSKEE